MLVMHCSASSCSQRPEGDPEREPSRRGDRSIGIRGSEFLRLARRHPRIEIDGRQVTARRESRCRSVPVAGGAYGIRGFSLWDPTLLDSVDTVVMALPHGASQALFARSWVGWLRRRSGRRLPPQGSRSVRHLVRRDPHRPRIPRSLRLRTARAVPRRDRSGDQGRGAGLLPDRGHPCPRPAVPSRADDTDASSSMPHPASPEPVDRPNPPRRSARWTRTSRHTACSIIATRPRWRPTSGRQRAVHPSSRPDEPRDSCHRVRHVRPSTPS